MSFTPDFVPDAKSQWQELDFELQELVLDEMERLAFSTPPGAGGVIEHDFAEDRAGDSTLHLPAIRCRSSCPHTSCHWDQTYRESNSPISLDSSVGLAMRLETRSSSALSSSHELLLPLPKIPLRLPYPQYVLTGTPEQQRRWMQVYELARLTDPQKQLLDGFVREMKILIVSGIWCGDCVQQCPLQQRIAEGNPGKIDLRILDRDQHRDLAEQVRINAGDPRPPSQFSWRRDFEPCSVFGDRTLRRYRALARKQLGRRARRVSLRPDQDEVAATLQD